MRNFFKIAAVVFAGLVTVQGHRAAAQSLDPLSLPAGVCVSGSKNPVTEADIVAVVRANPTLFDQETRAALEALSNARDSRSRVAQAFFEARDNAARECTSPAASSKACATARKTLGRTQDAFNATLETAVSLMEKPLQGTTVGAMMNKIRLRIRRLCAYTSS